MFGTHGNWAVRFFSVPHWLWHGASVYNGHLQGPVTLPLCRSFSCGDVTTCFYVLGLSRPGFEHPTFRLQHQRSYPLRHRRGWGFYDISKLQCERIHISDISSVPIPTFTAWVHILLLLCYCITYFLGVFRHFSS